MLCHFRKLTQESQKITSKHEIQGKLRNKTATVLNIELGNS